MRCGAVALSAWIALLATGCRTLPPATPLAPGDPRPQALLTTLRGLSEARHALRGVARISLEGPAGEGRAKQLLVVERPARLRVEILGFLNQTVAVLVTDGTRYQLFRSDDRSVEEGPVRPDLLEAVAGVRLTPAEAVDVVLGAPRAGPEARIVGGAALPTGGIRVALEDPAAAERRTLEFDEAGRLRRLRVQGSEGWSARFDDYRRVGEAWFAHEIELRFPGTGSRAALRFGDVELNPELPPGLFALPERSSEGRG